MAAHKALPSLGFSRQEHRSGLPFPSPMRESEVAQSRPTLCNPIDCSPPGPSVHGILQARTQEWVAISFSKRNYRKKESEVAQSSPTVCDPMDCSLPGSSIHGISQARVLEGVAMSFSMRSPHSTLILSIPPLQEPILLSILLFWGLGGSYYLLMGVFP